MKKIFKIISLIILIILTFNVVAFADDINEEYEENIIKETEKNEIEETANSDTKPTINSRRYAVYDRKSGRCIYGKDESKQSAMASTTKIMTAMVVVENCNLQDTVTINEKTASIGGSRLGLKIDDTITVNDLLYGLMLRSGNDAAIALAIHTSGNVEEFAKLMNNKAKEIGLKNTNFVTPHGLDDPNHYTTAFELAVLTDYALNNEVIANIVKTKTATIMINGNPVNINNTNELLGNVDGVYGVKTGFTNNAGRCLVTSVKRGDIDLIIVVLGADTRKDRAKDTIKLIEYVCKRYQVINVEEIVNNQFEMWKQINENRIYVERGKNGVQLELGGEQIQTAVLEKEPTVEISAVTQLEAPLTKETRIGTLTVKLDETIIEEIEIKLAKDVNKNGILEYLNIIAKIYSGKVKIF